MLTVKRYPSDIPQNAKERLVRKYKRRGSLISYRTTNCILNKKLVGRRSYTQDRMLVIETPLKDGKKYGREYIWAEDGVLESVEPYFQGKMHGVAKQYGKNGKVVGTYKLVHGTGFDIWRHQLADGSTFISEIHSLRNGLPDGYEWWLNENQKSVWCERHWFEGVFHGIEREWNYAGKLRRGYPKYWIRGKQVTKREYLKVVRRDNTLPLFYAKDNLPRRRFPV